VSYYGASGDINMRINLDGKPDGNTPLGKHRRGRNINMDFKGTCYGGVNWIHFAHDKSR
jgi:hypothetical protein